MLKCSVRLPGLTEGDGGLHPSRLLSVFVNSLYSFWWDVTNDWGLTILCPSEWSSTPKRTSLSKQPSTSSGLKYLPGANPTNTSHAYPPRSDVHKRTLSVSHHHRHPSLPPSAYSLSSSFSGAPDGIHPFGLRKEMHFPDPAVYYLAIAIDLVLRFTWSLKLSSHLHSISEIESGVFLMEGLELGRRWMWVFLRIEWSVCLTVHPSFHLCRGVDVWCPTQGRNQACAGKPAASNGLSELVDRLPFAHTPAIFCERTDGRDGRGGGASFEIYRWLGLPRPGRLGSFGGSQEDLVRWRTGRGYSIDGFRVRVGSSRIDRIYTLIKRTKKDKNTKRRIIEDCESR